MNITYRGLKPHIDFCDMILERPAGKIFVLESVSLERVQKGGAFQGFVCLESAATPGGKA